MPVYGVKSEENSTDTSPVVAPTPEESSKVAESLDPQDGKDDFEFPMSEWSLTQEETPDGAKPQKTDQPEIMLVKRLQERIHELDRREQRLREEEQRIEALRRDVEALAKQQQKLAADAVATIEKEKGLLEKDPTQDSLARLIKVYEAMDPEEAALRIGKMKEPLALDILAGIKPQNAAEILAGVEPTLAARLSEGLRFYSKRKTTVQSSGKN